MFFVGFILSQAYYTTEQAVFSFDLQRGKLIVEIEPDVEIEPF